MSEFELEEADAEILASVMHGGGGPDLVENPALLIDGNGLAPYRVIGSKIPSSGGGGTNPTPSAVSRWLFYHTDHLGSPRVIADVTGTGVSTHHYMPFGEEKPIPGRVSSNAVMFTGHQRDVESASSDNPDGLDYLLARYYSSSLGRFMEVDALGGKVGSPQSWNRYSYVMNNPLNLVDPTGLCSAPAGGNGVCIESFIAAPRINVLGIGDKRVHSATDPSLTSRIQVQIAVNSRGTLDVQTTAGFSEVLVRNSGWGKQGLAMTTVSNQATMADGSVSFTVNIAGTNGMAGWPFSPSDAIDISLNMSVSPNGQASIELGSLADGYPSLGIYSYSGGQPQTLYEGGEGNPGDLAPPMDRQIPPATSGRGSFFSTGQKPSRSAGGYVDEDGTHWSIQGANVR